MALGVANGDAGTELDISAPFIVATNRDDGVHHRHVPSPSSSGEDKQNRPSSSLATRVASRLFPPCASPFFPIYSFTLCLLSSLSSTSHLATSGSFMTPVCVSVTRRDARPRESFANRISIDARATPKNVKRGRLFGFSYDLSTSLISLSLSYIILTDVSFI